MRLNNLNDPDRPQCVKRGDMSTDHKSFHRHKFARRLTTAILF